jgi:hypothetical protein
MQPASPLPLWMPVALAEHLGQSRPLGVTVQEGKVLTGIMAVACEPNPSPRAVSPFLPRPIIATADIDFNGQVFTVASITHGPESAVKESANFRRDDSFSRAWPLG